MYPPSTLDPPLSSSHIPIPFALKLKTSCMAADWKRSKGQWENYEVATDLADKTTNKRAAVVLVYTGTEACELYTRQWSLTTTNSKKIMGAFEKHYRRSECNMNAATCGRPLDDAWPRALDR
jgi:hypothetical protein